MKKANKNKVFACGILNFKTALLMYLYENVIITKNKIGNNNNSWCAIAPKKFVGEILNSEIELVLSEDWKVKEAKSFW